MSNDNGKKDGKESWGARLTLYITLGQFDMIPEEVRQSISKEEWLKRDPLTETNLMNLLCQKRRISFVPQNILKTMDKQEWLGCGHDLRKSLFVDAVAHNAFDQIPRHIVYSMTAKEWAKYFVYGIEQAKNKKLALKRPQQAELPDYFFDVDLWQGHGGLFMRIWKELPQKYKTEAAEGKFKVTMMRLANNRPAKRIILN